MSDPVLKLKPRRAATAQSAAGAYGASQTRVLPGQPMPGQPMPGQSAPAAAVKPRSFLAVNWPLMTAAAALLAGGVVMGMVVGNAPRPQPTATVALTASAAVPPVVPSPGATAPATPATAAAQQGWRPISELAQQVAVALPPAPELPKLEPEPAVAVAPPPVVEVEPVKAEPARPESPKAETARIESKAVAPPPVAKKTTDKPVQLTAAPVAPPAFGRPAGEGAVPAWRARAVAPPAGARPPYVAFLIDDAGLDRKGTQRAINLRGPVTLSFMSYASDLSEQSAAARAAGHEVMLHLPMEPLDVKRNNPGPNALYVDLDAAELQRRLAWHLDRFSDYVGVNNHMGSRFTANAGRMGQVLDEIGRRQVFWLDSLSGPNSAGPALARQRGLDAAERDLFLDDDRSPGIGHELAAMERIARARGDVIAIGHPHGSTLTAMENWIATAKERGFTLVPVSTVLLRRQQQER
ncbi:divergent polysaccharide deacetylase family protein [Ferrovibrio terrae]|uniref:divergent polysaccharide deacetylase family protein n=1 Tax=Ferrovibrio terrae TaxID=2594003 RepID=UPI003137F101